MTSPFTAICTQRDDRWVGWIEEIPGVNAQERTKLELLASLKEILTSAKAEIIPGGAIRSIKPEAPSPDILKSTTS